MPDMTTIKLPKTLHRTVTSAARAEGLTAAQFIERLTSDHARRLRFAAVKRAHASLEDVDYTTEAERWEETSADGLDHA